MVGLNIVTMDMRLDDLDKLLYQLNVVIIGPQPQACDKRGPSPDGSPNLNELLRKSAGLGSRFEDALKQLHAILD